ncbi:LAMI_0H03994g1_1 [Lachancea mirantina]|uniref:LAMI_0H03994g1_1 n=1 Tax=Lachancea mirantina TaxID=1230905 RepID=A0A1G4KEG9_9SACH|nr:LAMI_0H03994g1_1 [Lachancea mirantina]
MSQKRYLMCEASRLAKRKNADIFRNLPKVPTTQYLEPRELTRDILYSGYRPNIYPMRENPLYKEAGKRESRALGKSFVIAGNAANQFSALAGPSGTGGISSGGVNGTWRYNPRIPAKLLPFSLWSASSMAMEYYPEWIGVPRRVVDELRPFSSPPSPPIKMVSAAAEPSAVNANQHPDAATPTTSAVSAPASKSRKKRSIMAGGDYSDKKVSKQISQFIKYLREKDER